ncbi:penicillin-binding protein 1A [Stutzerimonas xanthomarina]|uniref:Penicillin-binding protein 1A n=2 Tax=Stutzerimonas xanthomarina TaxID=271420 RepID=A0A1M5T8H5_9GAMM|nr:penicillin-binding protein 1A [Stutzerimonas xanthomarina]MCP9340380.1 penicillin-binding protein 1A [Stutzerimonas xanthomarina]SEH60525.1 penicillin-binding protein 1A [Stutzerimonas xanthomarina]SHH47014.1 penicillin-binding protein 1A [Stutzerimonas xanthomarina DSM 18231]
MRFLKFFLWSCLAVFCGLLLSLSGAFLYLSPNLPSVDSLRSIQLQIPLRVYSRDDKLIAEYGEMRRSPISFDQIPKDFIAALLSAEDDNFANHYGVDVSSLMRAATQLLKTGHIQTGGSTITMQVAKNYFLSSERSFSRKINEILLALQIERELSKDEILELYVNKIYLGNRSYGIEAAAQVYYGKPINELSLAQLAMIAGLPKAPSAFNPLANKERAKERRDWILGRMYRLGKIDETRYQQALAEVVDASYHGSSPELNAPYIAEMARAEMVGRFGSTAYTDGFRVYTTTSSERQIAANQALVQGLIEYDQRHGYRGPEAHLTGTDPADWLQQLGDYHSQSGLQPAVVSRVSKDSAQALLRDGSQHSISWESMKWARLYINTNSLGPKPKAPSDVVKLGDVIRIRFSEDEALFSQIPQAQGALVSLDPLDGSIEALTGGFSFGQSNYNRAIQAKRQPGSSFKPFVYSAALDAGFTPATLVNDSPIVFVEEGLDRVWRPKNDNNTFLGPIRLREALYKSRNLVSIRLLQTLGIPQTINYIERFGFKPEDLPANLSLALGTATLTPMEIATGWTAFANGGYKIEPYLIERIEDRDGKVIFSADPVRVPKRDIAHPSPAENNEATAISYAQNSSFIDENSSEPIQPPKHAEQIIDERTAYIMTSMLQDVIKRGTGRRALAMGRADIAGKTGTTNESKDSWFSGYNADIVTTVWAGFDQPQSLGRREYGGTVALPIWMKYMSTVLDGEPEHAPAEPEGILTLRIDPDSGRAAAPGTPDAYFEIFRIEDSPPDMDDELIPGTTIPGSPLPASETAPLDLF